MLHQSGAPTQVTRALRRYRQCRIRRLQGITRWLVLTSQPGVPHAESQGPLRHALCAVHCELSEGGPRLSWHHNSRAKTLTHEGDSTVDITQLFFLDSPQAIKNVSRTCTHTHAIKLIGSNRVLKDGPTPIADEEQRLNRKQRCTLS